MSEPDRMMARPREFAATPRGISTAGCWRDWHLPDLTPHDGLVRPNHPLLAAALGRPQSATSLKLLLRNPLGFVWKYALGWRAPELDDPASDLDAGAFGSLVHDILQEAVRDLERGDGVASAHPERIRQATQRAGDRVGALFADQNLAPPALLWSKRLEEAIAMAVAAISLPLPALRGQRSYAEVAFPELAAAASAPWPSLDEVVLQGTGLRITGRIDRLDLSEDGRQARVIDYKTGRLGQPVALDGGREIQRCLYASVVRAVLGPAAAIEAALLYPRAERAGYRPLQDGAGTMAILTTALRAAAANLLGGAAVPGKDAGDPYDDLCFALPSSPGSLLGPKQARARERLGEAASIWDEP